MVVVTNTEFEALFRAEYPRLVAFGVGMLGNLDVARDLAQETMARGNTNWETLTAADVPAAWLSRVMRNLVVDHLRRADVERRALQRVADRPEPSRSERLDDFAELVADLPDRQRTITTLKYANDLTVDEIARRLSIAPGTVKAQLFKARRSIGKRIEANDDVKGNDR